MYIFFRCVSGLYFAYMLVAVLGAVLVAVLGAVLVAVPGAGAQLLENVTKTYQLSDEYMQWLNRGGFDYNYCLRELLNCWENSRAEMVCFGAWRYYGYSHAGRFFGSVCDAVRLHCIDFVQKVGVDSDWDQIGFPIYFEECPP